MLEVLNLGEIWKFIKETGLLWLGDQFQRHKGPVKKASYTILFYYNTTEMPFQEMDVREHIYIIKQTDA